MAEKSGKKKTKKATKASADASVMGNLRSTRPERLGGHRRAGTTRATATRSSSATAAEPAPRVSSKPSTTAARRKATAKPKATTKPKVRPAAKVAAARPETPPAGWQTPGEDGRRSSGPPRGAEIVTTAVQAAGELAQIGVTVGGQLLKRAARRIPRP
jgi:hypothetical protein